MKILFVCTGNTCRSPMAQVMAAQILGEGHTIISSGLAAMPNMPASTHAITVMKERQIDLTSHLSQLVSEALIEEADLILTMTDAHKAALIPSAGDKVFTLGEYAVGSAISICDPFGGSAETYRKCAEEIHGLLLEIEQKIKQ